MHTEWSAPPWFVSVGDHGSDEARTQQRELSEPNTRAPSVNATRVEFSRKVFSQIRGKNQATRRLSPLTEYGALRRRLAR
jgi:hypothetical protein